MQKHSFALFAPFCALCALLRSFADLRLRSFADLAMRLRSFADLRLRSSEAFSLLVTFYSLLFRVFFVGFLWPSSAWKNSVWAFFVAFPWLFRGPDFGQLLCVLT